MTLESDLCKISNELNFHTKKLTELLKENDDVRYFYKTLSLLDLAIIDISHANEKISNVIAEVNNKWQTKE